MSNRILLCGYYGEHNLGDDALLQVLLAQLPSDALPVVTARDQELVQRRFGVATTDRRSLSGVLRALRGCDGLVLGGGSLLQDTTSFNSLLYYAALIVAAWLQRKPVVLWGQGLGPLQRRRSRTLVRILLPLVRAISWRDSASASTASSWGIQGVLGSDPVWGIRPHRWRGSGGPIVVCWRPTTLIQKEAWLPYLEALDRLAQQAERPVLWLPFHADQDRGLFSDLKTRGLLPPSLVQRSREVEAADPEAALQQFSSAGLVLAMRLHGLILAALAGAPTAALSYDPKVAAAAAAIGCPCHSLETRPPADLLEQWQQRLDHPADPRVIEALGAAAQRHRAVLQSLMEARAPQRGSSA